MNKSRKVPVFLCLLVVTAFFSGCGDDADKTSDHDAYTDLMALGKGYLTLGDGDQAADAFEQALKLRPDSTEAKYGIALTGSLAVTHFVDQVLESVGGISFSGDDDEEKSMPKEGWIDDNAIHLYLSEYLVEPLNRAETAYLELASEPSLSFPLDEFNISVGGETYGTFAGNFDKTELHFFGAVTALSEGLFRFLIALNLDFDYTKLAFPESDPDADTLTKISTYIDLIRGLLESERFPDFLYLDENQGQAQMRKAGLCFGAAFQRLHAMYYSVATEGIGHETDPIHYTDIDGNGKFDIRRDPVEIGDLLSLSSLQGAAIDALAIKLSDVFYEGSILDEDPISKNVFQLSDLNEILHAFGAFPLHLGDADKPFIIPNLPNAVSLNIGGFFSNPSPDGLRPLLEGVVDLWDFIEKILSFLD